MCLSKSSHVNPEVLNSCVASAGHFERLEVVTGKMLPDNCKRLCLVSNLETRWFQMPWCCKTPKSNDSLEQ